MTRPASVPARDGAAKWTELIEQYTRFLSLTNGAQQQRVGRSIVRRFLWRVGFPPARRIDGTAVETFLAGLRSDGRSRKTLINCLSHLSVFCNWLVGRGFLPANPCEAIKLAKAAKPPPHYLKSEELPAARRAAEAAGILPEFLLAVSTGLRLAELARLRWTDVDSRGRTLMVRLAKGGKFRTVPLNAVALEALRRQRQRLDAQGLTSLGFVFPARQTWPGGWRYVDRQRCDASWGRMFRPVQKAVATFTAIVGVGRAWHCLRHTFASTLAQQNVGDGKLAGFLGHSDVRTVAIYRHLREGYDADIERACPPAEPVLGAPGAEYEI
jgi:integrase